MTYGVWCDSLDKAWNMCHDHDLHMCHGYSVMQLQAPCIHMWA